MKHRQLENPVENFSSEETYYCLGHAQSQKIKIYEYKAAQIYCQEQMTTPFKVEFTFLDKGFITMMHPLTSYS